MIMKCLSPSGISAEYKIYVTKGNKIGILTSIQNTKSLICTNFQKDKEATDS
jgi:hypothetical protein